MCLTTSAALKLVAMLWAASMGTSKQELRYHEVYFLHTLLLLASKLSQQEGNWFRTEKKKPSQLKLLKHPCFLALQKCQHNLEGIYLEFGISVHAFLDLQTRGSEEPCTPHHTRTAVYSCWVLVPAMSSPVVTSDCFLREVLLSMNKNIMAWERMKVCNEIWLTSLATNLLPVWG